MAYPQYTHCTPSSSFDPLNRPLAAVGGIVGFVALVTAVIVGGPVSAILIFVGGVAGYTAITAVFEYLLGGKLICLGGDRMAVGRVAGVEPPSSKQFPANLDNDYSFNVLLCPYEPTEGYETPDLPSFDPAAPKIYDDLVMQQNASSVHGVPFSGYDDGLYKPLLHCEIEGSRIADTYAAFLAAWTVLTAAAIVATALATVPVIGWLLALIAMLVGALIAGAIVAATWLLADDGSVDDIDPTIGELHRGDFVVVQGTWTYDSGHNDDNDGWNELHPLKYLSKAERCPNAEQAKEWAKKVGETFDADVRQKQSERSNRWRLHPRIDGCKGKPKAAIG